MGTELQFGKIKKFWSLVIYNVNILNTNTLYTEKMAKMINFVLCVICNFLNLKVK